MTFLIMQGYKRNRFGGAQRLQQTAGHHCPVRRPVHGSSDIQRAPQFLQRRH